MVGQDLKMCLVCTFESKALNIYRYSVYLCNTSESQLWDTFCSFFEMLTKCFVHRAHKITHFCWILISVGLFAVFFSFLFYWVPLWCFCFQLLRLCDFYFIYYFLISSLSVTDSNVVSCSLSYLFEFCFYIF